MPSLLHSLTIVCLLPATAAQAEEAELSVPEIVVTGSEHERALDEPGFVTVVEVPDSASPSAAENIAEVVGVHVRALGGLGSFAALSVRGSPSSQTAVLVDGVPLSRLAVATFDLGSLESSTFDRIEVYRGAPPPGLQAGSMGAVNFVTRVGTGTGPGSRHRFVLGGGSYGARLAKAERQDTTEGGLDTTVVVSYLGAEGDHEYFDDGGTPVNLDDDELRDRENNGFDHLEAVGRLRYRGDDWGLEGGERFAWRTQGVPGATGARALDTRIELVRSITDVGVDRIGVGGSELDLRGRAFALFEQLEYEDPESELGFGVQDSRYRTWGLGVATGGTWRGWEHQRLSLAVEGLLERFRRHSYLPDPAEEVEPRGTRLSGAVTLSDELGDESWAVIPAVSWQALSTDSEGTVTGFGLEAAPDSRFDHAFRGDLGARVRVGPRFTVKGSAGRTFRSPTLSESFGDRGALVGNPHLEPESGWRADLGVVWSPAARGPFDQTFLEAAGFAARHRNLIVFMRTGTQVAMAQNLEATELAGAELVATTRIAERLALAGNYTLLATRQQAEQVSFDGKEVPGRPRHELYARADWMAVRRARLEFNADVTFMSGEYLDAGNLQQVPARHFVGVGATAVWRGVRLLVEAKNLLDARVEDVDLGREIMPGVSAIPRAVADSLGYPLPGRALYASVAVELD